MKTAVVTGANVGLGLETTLELARSGYRVVMACRDAHKAKDAISQIIRSVPEAELSVMVLDLADLASVRSFAQAFRREHDQLDLLINNAGVMWVPYQETVDGFELHMAANYFGHYLLTSLLLDLMPDTSDSRIVSLSSIVHTTGLRRIRFEDINWKDGYDKYKAYAQSKLACLVFANDLDRRLRDSGRNILSVAAHPGVSFTNLTRNLPRWQENIARFTVGRWLTHPPQEAAKPTIRAAIGTGVTGGDYYGPTGFREMKGPVGIAAQLPYADDREVADRLWEISTELTGADWSTLEQIGTAGLATRHG